jgi:hypothetical protein
LTIKKFKEDALSLNEQIQDMQEFIDEKDERILELEEIRKQLEALSYKKDIEIRNVIN